MRGWRLALRIAWREAKRAKGRTAMVLAMITLPVAALAFAAAGYDLFTLTPGEQADRLMGTGRAVVVWPYDTPVQQRPDQLVPFTAVAAHTIADPTTDRLLSLLPPGSRAIPKVSGALTVHTASGIGTLASLTLDDRDPLAGGLLRQLSGRAPAGADEVALTPAAVERTGAGVGGVVTAAS
jgi:putative ABC transport system permease protein